ncbi:30S ribosomal protein S6e [Candidatus Pacearchaeota archaeon CG10_big_fil_rev_8_21_14_0_10_35_13]|nr:MAG: 30S ribosomal protein S6e [Candidatus Pacearchaeota archaeon CG10_big_fil_rev_8_21_14_0_10_35_13]
MVFKLNISDKGKAWKKELEEGNEVLIGKRIGDTINGDIFGGEFEGYTLEITGTSDKAGFPGMKGIDSQVLVKKLLKKGFAMKQSRPKGLRLRKTLRGAIISEDTIQINLNVIKTGKKGLKELFPEQNKEPEPEIKEEGAEEKPVEEKKEEVVEKTE